MARIFITGSADGLGKLAANELINRGHQVVIHARNEKRAQETLIEVPNAETVLIADLSSIEETKQLAAKVNALGRFDVVIHNAGIYNAPGKDLLAVNTLAPYILTCLIKPPKRLIYLSSGMHQGGTSKLERVENNPGNITYSDTKLHIVLLCKAVARHWHQVYANALDPGWVPTKMGGAWATDSLEGGYQTQVWLAISTEEPVKASGKFFYHQQEIEPNPEASKVEVQDEFMALCAKITGVVLA